MLKAILFDFGGTLDSDGVHWVDQFRAAYEAAGYAYGPETFNPAFFASDRRISTEYDMRGKPFLDLLALEVDLIHEELGIGGGGETGARKARIVREFEARTARALNRNREILSRLAQRYGLGVVSNFCGNVDIICREYGLLTHLRVVIDSFVAGVEKPDPAIFRLALEKMGVEAEEAVFVGDNLERDIRPAKALGMGTVWLRGPDSRFPPDPPEADSTIQSLTELEDLL